MLLLFKRFLINNNIVPCKFRGCDTSPTLAARQKTSP